MTRSSKQVQIITPEDAARHYDMAGLDGWVDEPDESSWGTVAFLICLLALAVIATFGSMLLAAVVDP